MVENQLDKNLISPNKSSKRNLVAQSCDQESGTKNGESVDQKMFHPQGKVSGGLEVEKEWSNQSIDSVRPNPRRMMTGKYKNDTNSSLSSDIEEVQSNIPKLPQLSKPLPIYEGARDDSRINAGFRRATKIFSEMPVKNNNVRCEHEDVSDWVCNNCKVRIPQFDCFLDDNQGKVGQNFRICFENQFLQDFLTDQTHQVCESDSSESEDDIENQIRKLSISPKQKEDRSNPDIIYVQFEPKNVTELREYMLFCISRQLQELESWNKEKEERAIRTRLEMKAEVERRNEQLRQQIVREKTLKQNADLIDIVDATSTIRQSLIYQETFTNRINGDKEDLKENQHVSTPLSKRQNQYFVPFPLSDKIGSGKMKNLSPRLTRFLQELLESQERLVKKHKGNVLLFDSVFESGNLLRADRLTSREYRLYMQVDTNTKGHQQWFYFRVRNTKKDQVYKFMIMNFTKPGVTGGSGYRKNELFQRIMFKSKKSGNDDWQTIKNEKLEFQKTRVQRKKKDALAACDDSDQEDWVEEAFGNDINVQNTTFPQADLADGAAKGVSSAQKEAIASLKKKKRFFYYALVFNVSFEHDDDIVYFAFAQPYPYTQIVSQILEREEEIKNSENKTSPDKFNKQNLTQWNEMSERQEPVIEQPQSPNANPQSDEQELIQTTQQPENEPKKVDQGLKINELKNGKQPN